MYGNRCYRARCKRIRIDTLCCSSMIPMIQRRPPSVFHLSGCVSYPPTFKQCWSSRPNGAVRPMRNFENASALAMYQLPMSWRITTEEHRQLRSGSRIRPAGFPRRHIPICFSSRSLSQIALGRNESAPNKWPNSYGLCRMRQPFSASVGSIPGWLRSSRSR